MLTATRKSRGGANKAQISTVFSLPALTGGLNAKDGFTAMEPRDAVTLDNWFPEAQYVTTRGGSLVWKSGMGSAVRTLMTWLSPSGSDKIFAAAGTKFWNVTASGGNASSVVTGLTNADWQWTNIATSSTTAYLVACNGADHVSNYDGTSWTNPTITGVTDTTLINVALFKLRLWFAQVNTLSLWYLPTQAIAGAATEFPIGAYARRGGYIMAIGSFSQDSGDGPDDYLVAVTSNGQAVVFEGIDPSNANTFGLNGVFDIGRPIGRRCVGRLNGDMTIVTSDGVVSMRAMLQYGRESDQKAAITGKIQTLFSQASQNYSSYFGWQILVFPKTRYCIVNYPVVADSQQKQFVMNTVTGAWCTFSGLNAGCWGIANDLLYFGGNDGKVYQAAIGNADSGNNIVADLKTAWSDFAHPGKKMVSSIKPILLTGGGTDYQHRINWDFDDTPPSNTVSGSPVAGGTWSMTWPWTWGGQNVVDARWRGGGGVGTWGAVHFRVTVNGAGIQHNGFNVLMQPGGP